MQGFDPMIFRSEGLRLSSLRHGPQMGVVAGRQGEKGERVAEKRKRVCVDI